MAEIILSAFLTALFETLGTAALKTLPHFKEIHPELTKWEMSLSHIQALLDDASQKEATTESVKQWLNRLQHLAYDIDDRLDALAIEAIHRELTEDSRALASKVRKLIPTCCTSFPLTTGMHDKLDDITTKLQELVDEKNNLGLVVKDKRPKKMNRKKETCLPDVLYGMVGRHGEKNALLHKLLGDDDEACKEKFSIVPIVGMGGVGKTTLARHLYNHKKVNDHFQLKAWVCVSDEFDIPYISQVIYQHVTRENTEFQDLSLLQVALSEKLKEKRCLIVLDDVWSESYADWETLVRPFHSGAPGSKIIMTTRKERLLQKLGYDHLDRVESLSSDDALSLLAQHALGVDNFDSHPALKPHGVGIVKKCGGLPLALKALGRLLRTKTDEEDWEDVLNSEIWELDNGDEIVPALRLSYLDLPARLKQLFAYCSLFPKDYLFDKEELILLWMAEGFLQQSKTSKSMERLGQEYFDKLLSRSFFQHAPNVESLYVMHDLMNDFAMSVAGDFCLRLDGEMKKEALEKYRHMSFVRKQFTCYNKFKEFKRAKSLRTFLAVSAGVEHSLQPFYFSNKILVDLLPLLPLLRVLRLSCFEIIEVPESIGSLKHLRYLNLSQTRIKHLPENVCNLYNLQTLILFGCYSLTKLPDCFIKLKNLRHLDIRGTYLEKMPLGIGKLKNLQTLPKIVFEGDNDFGVPEIKNLHGEISIKGLDKVKNPMHAREAKLSEKRFSELKVEWSDKYDGSRKETHEMEVLNVLKPHHDNLKNLSIKSYGGIGFPNWVGDPSFFQLSCVSIHGCIKCTALPPLGQLQSLKELYIGRMDKVKVMGSEFFGTGQAFPSLEILHFIDMPGWEEWSTKSGIVDASFPCLRVLVIRDCPNLVEVSLEALPSQSGVVGAVFPCLQELRIENCPKLIEVSLEALPSLRVLKLLCADGLLRSLVQLAPSITILHLFSISGLTDEVWRSVMGHLRAVEEVFMSGCNKIRYLWESEAEASKFLVNLRKLLIMGCSNLVRLGEKEEDNCGCNLTSLRILDIVGCARMEHISCPNSIEELHVYSCDSVTSVSFPTGGGKKLKSLSINNCKKLLEKELGGGEKTMLLINNTSLSMLESIQIRRWPNLRSISESIGYFIHLAELAIVDCPNLESFPDPELLKLTSLTRLTIFNCPSMDYSFSHGLWPPTLSFLQIGKLKKQVSEWSPQNFPSSLVNLELRGEDASNFSQLSHILPSSLTTLEIWDFKKLESFSMALQHLNSLQHLKIFKCPMLTHIPETTLQRLTISNCPKLTHLPEITLQHLEISLCPKMIHLPETMLLPSLLSLTIRGCPDLKEKCSRRGSYWPLISHIPYINIY